jgi:DNA-binding IclR family transcriptional regulator
VAVKPSASADRTARLLVYLGTHDDEFTLTELAGRVGIDKTTCQSTLLALVHHALVTRNERTKRYSLGPAAYALADPEHARRPLVRLARAELEELAHELAIETVATVTASDCIVVVARVLRAEPFGLSLRVGQTAPLVPPLGTVHIAWSSDEAIDTWIRRAGTDVTAADVERYRRAVTAVRERGYSATLDESTRARFHAHLKRLADQPTDAALVAERDQLLRDLGHAEYQLLELEAAATYRVNQISAPVFGPDGTVVMALGLMTQDELPAAEVPRMARRLIAKTSNVTHAIGGRTPESCDRTRTGHAQR